MSADLPGDNLFVGQVVALTPLEGGWPDESTAALLGAEAPPTASERHRPRLHRETYSIVTYAPRRGILILGRQEIDVAIAPLEVNTPPEATVFRITSVSGRSIRVTRAVSAPHRSAG